MYYEDMDEFIDSEMHKVRDQTISRLSSIIVHPAISIKAVLLTISYGYFESYGHAETLAQQLNLGKIEFLAVAEDFDAFKEEYLREMELAQNF